MKYLVYGAGVLGCNLAHQLFQGQKDVVLLARNEWYQTIQDQGLVIRNRLTHMKSIDKIQVTQNLSGAYDVIFVVLQNTQIDLIFDELQNADCKNIVFIGNNMNVDRYVMTDKNVLFGFYQAAGKRENKEVCSFDMKKITIGRCDGSNESDDLIRDVFSGTKIKVNLCNKMDDHLKSHAAFILPFAFASYHYNHSLKPLKKDETYLSLMINATLEMYDALIAKGYEILPKGDYEYSKEGSSYRKFAKTLSNLPFLAKACVCEHANTGKKEMLYLKNEFEKMFKETGMTSTAFDEICNQ